MRTERQGTGTGKAKGASNRREKAGTERDEASGRARLVRVALRLFGERGYDATSVTDIAEAAQVSRGLIRFHFGSKQALSEAVERLVVERLSEVIDSFVPQIGTVSMANLFIARLSGFEQEQDFRNYLRRCVVEPTPRNLELFKKLHEQQKRLIARFSALGARQLPIGEDWLALVSVFLQLGPIVFSAQVQAVLGRDPTTARGAEALAEVFSKLFERVYGLNSIDPGAS